MCFASGPSISDSALTFFHFRVRLECGPILPGLLTTRMRENIDKQVLRIGCIFGTPKANALHVVALENGVGMIAKASNQSIHFAVVNGIEAQFIDMRRGIYRFHQSLSYGFIEKAS